MQLGGILVYDSYASIIGGSERVQSYYEKRNFYPKVKKSILFTESEQTEAKLQIQAQVRDRDFMTDLEKQMYARVVRQDMKAGKMKGVKSSFEVPVLHN